jgi:hypothetical protein
MKYIKLFESPDQARINTIIVYRPIDYEKLSNEDKLEFDNAKYHLGESVLRKIGFSGSSGTRGLPSTDRENYFKNPCIIEGVQVAILNTTKIISYLILDEDNYLGQRRIEWVSQNQLIAEYELDANKYNL